MRILFTGGSGKAGRHVVPWLRDKGYDILNLDLSPLDCEGGRLLWNRLRLSAIAVHHHSIDRCVTPWADASNR